MSKKDSFGIGGLVLIIGAIYLILRTNKVAAPISIADKATADWKAGTLPERAYHEIINRLSHPAAFDPWSLSTKYEDNGVKMETITGTGYSMALVLFRYGVITQADVDDLSALFGRYRKAAA